MAQEAAWQSQVYVLIGDQFELAKRYCIGHYPDTLTSRAVAA